MLPDELVERGAAVFLHGRLGDVPELAVAPIPPGEADEGEPGGQQPPVSEVVDRWQEFAGSEVPGHPEDDEAGGACYPREAPIGGIAQRVTKTVISHPRSPGRLPQFRSIRTRRDRKSTRLNSSHVAISYAVFGLKKKILQ